jgi:biopolymer transport protein ExbD
VITRPLDLLSKLRPTPRNYDSLFLVNGALIALFFALFGSRFVLSPGLRVDGKDFQLSPGPGDSYVQTPISVSVNANGQIWGDSGQIADAHLKEWMAEQIKRAPGSTLLVLMDTRASMEIFTRVAEEARAAGFRETLMAMQKVSAPK